MLYDGLAIATVVIAALVLLISLKILLRGDWLLGWLKGMFGFALVTLALLFTLSAWDIFSYRQVLAEKSIATISFARLAPQRFDVTLVESSGFETNYELSGDQWQLDARVIKWHGFMAASGFKPGYRLDRLAGRYYSLEQERNAKRSVFNISRSPTPVDLWRWLRESNVDFSVVDAVYGSATFVPMRDGALFEVSLSQSGLLARPLNDPASEAVKHWQ